MLVLSTLARLGVADGSIGGVDTLRPEAEDATLPSVRITVMTLGQEDRMKWLRNNRRVVPGLHAAKAVNGFNKTATTEALLHAGIRFRQLCGQPREGEVVKNHMKKEDHSTRAFETWGTLANDITRVLAIKQQVHLGIPFAAVIEDDLELQPGFSAFLSRLAQKTWPQPTLPAPELVGSSLETHRIDYIILGRFGEGYLFSLAGARNVLRAYQRHGFHGCPDQQLMSNFMPEVSSISDRAAPWRPLVSTNMGAIMETSDISADEKALLQRLHSSVKDERDTARKVLYALVAET